MSDAQVTAQILAEIERAAGGGEYELVMDCVRVIQSTDVLCYLGYGLTPMLNDLCPTLRVSWCVRVNSHDKRAPMAVESSYSAQAMEARADAALVRIKEADAAAAKAQADEAIALLESWKKEGV